MTKNNPTDNYSVKPIGMVQSKLKILDDCPFQEHEGAPEAWLEIFPDFREGLEGITARREVILFTWLHKAQRNLLKQYTRDERDSPLVGVFGLRSPHRPNPIGMHHVKVLEIEDSGRIRVSALEVLDGTPIIDMKPVIDR